MKKVARYFDNSFELFGNNIQSLGWYSWQTQEVRFDCLATIGDLRGKKILDVGCGLGNFCAYLQGYYDGVEYTGIDVSEKMYKQAKRNYPDVEILKTDLQDYYPEKTFDYVFASGTFNMKLKENYKYLENNIKKMWSLAEKGIAFNVLSSYAPARMVEDIFYYYRPEKVFGMCKKMTDLIVLRHDYLLNDFTVLMSK